MIKRIVRNWSLFAIVCFLSIQIDTNVHAQTCPSIFTAQGRDQEAPEQKKITEKIPVLANIGVDGKPNIIDLKKVFPNLEQRIFIGIEAWGHSFLQVGTVRLDGHVLKPNSAVEQALTMRHGMIVEIKDLGPTQIADLQREIRARNGQMAISCVHEAVSLLMDYASVDVSGVNKRIVWLSDLSSMIMTQAGNSQASLQVSFTKKLNSQEWLARLRRQELSWRNQIIEKLSGESMIQDALLGKRIERSSVVEIVRRQYSLSEHQAKSLVSEFFEKVESGAHSLSRRDSVSTEFKTDDQFATRFTLDQLNREITKVAAHARLIRKNSVLAQGVQPQTGMMVRDVRERPAKIDLLALKMEWATMSEPELRDLRVKVLLEYNPKLALRAMKESSASETRNNLVVLFKEIQRSAVNAEKVLATARQFPGIAEMIAMTRTSEILEVGNRLGLAGSSLSSSLLAFFKSLQTSEAKVVKTGKWLDVWAGWHMRTATSSHFQLRAGMFAGLDIGRVVVDTTTMNSSLAQLQRFTANGRHTLHVQDYVERHFAPETLDWIAHSQGLVLRIYGSSRKECLKDLFDIGFTDIAELQRNKMTDFVQFIARRPETGETTFIVQTLPGRATVQEAVAHFLYHVGPQKIDPSRIQIFRSSLAPEIAMANVLTEAAVRPNAIVVGNTIAAAKEIQEMGGREVKTIMTEDLSGTVFQINGKTVLLASIEPRLFGDRAAALINGAVRSGAEHPVIIFSGTAGSLSPALQINELVVPTEFGLVNGLSTQKVDFFHNSAVDVINSNEPGMHVGRTIRHGSVDSILYEDQVWFDRHSRRGADSIDVVEQELYDLAVEANRQGSRLYAVLKISDELYSGLDFSATEANRRGKIGPAIGQYLRLIFNHELVGSPP